MDYSEQTEIDGLELAIGLRRAASPGAQAAARPR